MTREDAQFALDEIRDIISNEGYERLNGATYQALMGHIKDLEKWMGVEP